MKMIAEAVVIFDSREAEPRVPNAVWLPPPRRPRPGRRLARLEQDREDQDQTNDDVQDDD